jgi:hypothetical protein
MTPRGTAGPARYDGFVLKFACIFALVAMTIAPADAKKNGKNSKGSNHSTVVVRFAPAEIDVIHGYYRAYPVNLPPGLQKKVSRGTALPPGWQKKLQPFPAQLEARLPAPCGYCGRGVVDGYGVVYDKRTSIILDVVQLVADIVR